MQWGENWRLYLTPGDGLLISLLEEFLSKSVSFINDISLCSARHLSSSQKGNYLFRPGNNISYCLSSRARRGVSEEEGEKNRAKGSCPQTDGCQGPLNLQAGSFPHAKRTCECVRIHVCVSVCVCVCDWGEETWGHLFHSLAWNSQHWLIHSTSI